ncbi:hypothetical protein K523DRAFT_252501 [Schizophyllum commune Tattone D]|nr:hypothetical protein K523DRAFT_252501 [Schizophyllum commune Tattone D]
MSVLSPFFFLFALASAYLAAADRNVTVDDTSSDIRYSGDWTTSTTTELDYGGTHQLTEDHSATAKLTFTGNAVYFMSPRWPYTVNVAVSVDGGEVSLIDLIDHDTPTQDGGSETKDSEVVWARTGLDNAEHTLTVSVGGGQQFAIVDAIIYTVEDEETTTANPTSTQAHTSQSTSATETSSSESEPSATQVGATGDHKKNGATIAASVTVAVLGMLAVALTFFCMSRRKRKQQQQQGSLLHHAPTFEKFPPDSDYGAHAELNYLTAVSPASSRTFVGSQGFPSPSDGPKYAHYPQFSPTTAGHDIPDATSTSAAPHPYAVAPATPAPLTTAQLQEAFRNRTLQSDSESVGAWPAPIQQPQQPAQVPNSYNPAPSAYVPPSGVHRLSTITEMSSIASLQPSMQSLQSAAAPSSAVQPLQPPAALGSDSNRLSAAPSEHDLPYLSASPTRQSFRLSGSGAGGERYAESSGGASDFSAGTVSNVSVPQDAVNPMPTPKRTHSIKRVPPPKA